MARCEPRVHTVNSIKYQTCQKDLILVKEKNMIERERERGKKSKHFSGDFTGFCRLKLGRWRVTAALRDESYAWVLESQDFAKVQGSRFHRNREKGCVSGNHSN